MSAIAKLYEAVNAIAFEFKTCIDRVYDTEQYTVPANSRSTGVLNLEKMCSAAKIAADYRLLQSDTSYAQYGEKDTYVNPDAITGAFVDELSKKYQNRLVDDQKFKIGILSKSNLTAAEAEEMYRKEYVNAMLDREIAANPAKNSVHCLNRPTMDAYFKLVKRYGTDLLTVHYRRDMYAATKPDDYPSHVEYLQCAEARKKMA